MAKLSQILAVEKNAKNTAQAVKTKAYHEVQKQDLFVGLARTYVPKSEGGLQLPPERKVPQASARAAIDAVKKACIDLFDITSTKDATNQGQRADIIVDGQAIVKQVPVTTLLFLEKQLTDLRTFASTLPRLDPGEQWSLDANAGMYLGQPTQAIKTEAKIVPVTLAPATDKHPAQVKESTVHEAIGVWTTVKFSTALPAVEHAAICERVEKLLRAVKYAREECNGATTVELPIGAPLLNYLFG